MARISDDGLRAWPNPVEEVLYIEGAAGKNLDVLDVTGRVVLRERTGGPSHLQDVTHWPLVVTPCVSLASVCVRSSSGRQGRLFG